MGNSTITGRERGLCQQDKATPHFHDDVREYLDAKIPRHRIGCASRDDSPLLPWPTSPDLTSCEIFLRGYVKDRSPLLHNLSQPRERITHAANGIDRQTYELDYRINICRIRNGVYRVFKKCRIF